MSATFAPTAISFVQMRPSRSAAVKPEMRILPSSVAGSIGVANCTLTPKRPPSLAPSAGEVPATDGEAIVVNETVRSFAVAPPCAPRRPVPIVTVYVVFTPRRCVGLNESTVRVSFHESFPGGTLPEESRIAKPACADGSIGWLNATSTCCHGPQ